MVRSLENPDALDDARESVAFSPSPDLAGKRVGMVTFSSYPSDPRPRRAVDSLLKAGMSVDLICQAEGGSLLRETLGPLRVTRLPISNCRGGKLSYAHQYSSFILLSGAILAARSLRRHYHLIHVHNMPDVLVASALVPKLFGAKVLLDLHDPMPELMTTIFHLSEQSSSVRLIKLLEKWSIAFASRVVTVNIACKRIFTGRSCRPEKIGVVMNSPDEEIFPFRRADLKTVTKRPVGTPLVVMYHGSLVERNGLDLAVAALAEVRQTAPDIELRIFGRKTPFLDEVMADAHAKGLDGCVRYLGPRGLEDLVHEIDCCDVGVIPNRRNAFTDINTPTRIFEYLSRGKPVIAPRTPGIQDYFDPESLLFFGSGDVKELAQCLLFVASQPQESAEIARRGQEIYHQHMWSQERQTFVKLVSELLEKRAATGAVR